jgi:hypothetical protein
MRASTIPLLENEPLVLVRASFLALCDGNHCAAALLNDFVYWHDWCVAHGRYDAVAGSADPDHQAADLECWFWKTTEGLANDDLLRLWGEKKVRAAAELLEAKGYAQSRFNPKDRYDRTKQYRLVSDRLAAELQIWASAQDGLQHAHSPELPSRFGKNAECTQSTSCGNPPIRQKCRMHAAKGPDVPTEITHSETTQGVDPSSSSSVRRLEQHTGRTKEDGSQVGLKKSAQLEKETQAKGEPSTTAALIIQWAADRHVRRRLDDRSYGSPDAHWAAAWGLYCEERGICEQQGVFEVMDSAKSAADSREQWRFWKYLDEQVQQAAERYVAPAPPASAIPGPVLIQPVEDPHSEWAQVKRRIAERINPDGYANWVELTCQVGWNGPCLLVWVPDEVTRDWLENEYAVHITEALASLGYAGVEYTRQPEHSESSHLRSVHQYGPCPAAATGARVS